MKNIELLAPAKDLYSGIAAIKHGADAVYIGAPKFGARIAAGNSLPDIKQLVDYAHIYYARVYVTLNTILFNHELSEAEKLIHDIYLTGADAIIIQDPGILEMNLPPIPLFASTQMHNYSWEKVKFLEDAGIQRVILARELSLKQIREIRSKTNVDLEFFIHGALCVSLSGQCYFSHALGKGSANRGACAQPCRAYYSLKDSDNRTLLKNKHLLSLKDLNLTNYIDDLLDAGITSFKIEGRLKDLSYIKNITSHYRLHIDKAISSTNKFRQQSTGKIVPDFIPDPEKTFNRDYTNYFLNGRTDQIASFNTPKSVGKFVGTIKSVHKDYFILDTQYKISHGDGLCFFNTSGILQGLKVNKVENSRIYFDHKIKLNSGIKIYRNFDHNFNKILSGSKTERKIDAVIELSEINNEIIICATDSDNNFIQWKFVNNFEKAKNTEAAFENIKNQFTKSGQSVFEIKNIRNTITDIPFIPISELNKMRRKTLDLLFNERMRNYPKISVSLQKTSHPYPENTISYKSNVLNELAIRFYKRHGVEKIEKAFETNTDFGKKEIMITRHCIKYALGGCSRYNKNPKKLNEPLFLEDNNRKYPLDFDCKNCVMKVIYND